MKFIGQYIQSFIARFRNDVYLEDISTGTIASGSHLGLDSNNKIVKAADGGGDIEGVTAGTGLSGGGTTGTVTLNVDVASAADRGIVELATTAETTTGTDTNRAVTPDGLKDGYQGSANVATLGTITTGVWQGTAIATAYIADDAITEDKLANTLLAEIDANTAKSTNVATNLSVASSTGSRVIASSDGTNATIPIATTSVSGVMSTTIFDEHTANNAKATNRAYFEFKGYGNSDGTNYEMPEIISDNNAPFEHNTSTGSDGLTAQAVTVVMRQGGVVMPYTGTLKSFNGWVTTQGTGTVDVGIFKFTPVDNNASTVTPVLLVNEQITGAGNTKMRYFSETSSFDAGFTAGDVLYSAVLGSGSGKSWYLNSMLEVEWS